MSKKNWIMIKRGLITDPQHRKNLGELIWLYIHILDRADWETGTVTEWRDAAEAVDLDMPLVTLRQQRRKLEAKKYITHIQGRRVSSIIIHKWINPRRYDGIVLNNGDTNGDTVVLPLQINGDTNGDTNGDKVPSQNLHSSLDHKITNQVTPTSEIKTTYEILLGYSLNGEWKAGEGKAAKVIGNGFTSQQLEQAYKHYKADKFWKDKRLTLHYLSEQMPELFSTKSQSLGDESIQGRKVYQ